MKNVKNVNYLQIDHKIRQILTKKGVIILSSPEAWEKYSWVRKYFESKPKEGYFIWVKKQIDFPLSTCITIASPKISQSLRNLLVIEKNIKARANVVCNVSKRNLCGSHKASGKLILKENSTLDYNHFHSWGEKDFVNPEYEFFLGKGSQLNYTYKNLSPPKELKIRTTVYGYESSSTNLSFIVNGINSRIDLHETLFLKGNNARGVVRLRIVGRKNSEVNAYSKIVAEAPGRGHLDCQGLLVSKDSKIRLVPELLDKNKKALITHEASIGRISEEELNYLRSRGLTEKEAINLIVNGFLNE